MQWQWRLLSAERKPPLPDTHGRKGWFRYSAVTTRLFWPDRSWQSRNFATVTMSSVTGRPPGYEGCGGFPWESPHDPAHQCGEQYRLLSILLRLLFFSAIGFPRRWVLYRDQQAMIYHHGRPITTLSFSNHPLVKAHAPLLPFHHKRFFRSSVPTNQRNTFPARMQPQKTMETAQ